MHNADTNRRLYMPLRPTELKDCSLWLRNYRDGTIEITQKTDIRGNRPERRLSAWKKSIHSSLDRRTAVAAVPCDAHVQLQSPTGSTPAHPNVLK